MFSFWVSHPCSEALQNACFPGFLGVQASKCLAFQAFGAKLSKMPVFPGFLGVQASKCLAFQAFGAYKLPNALFPR
eukprot:1562362-Amphidinium_carterae.1